MQRRMRWTCTVEGCDWHVTEVGDEPDVATRAPRPVRANKKPAPHASMAEAVRRARRRDHGVPGAVRRHWASVHGVPEAEVGPEHFRGGWTGVGGPRLRRR